MRVFVVAVSVIACTTACSDRPGCTRTAPRSDGPGDPSNFFPVATGNVWNYEVTASGTPAALGNLQVTGARPGTTAQVFREALLGDAATAPSDTYLTKDASGVTEEAGSSTDEITRLVLPIQRVAFPLEQGRSFVPVQCAGIDLGQDLDGDGTNERFDYRSAASVGAAEQVALPVGSVTAVPVKTTSTVTVHGSKGRSATVEIVRTEWYAAGIGLVQSVTSGTNDGAQVPDQTVRLAGYSVDGKAKGLVRYGQLATAVALADSDTSMPGQPALSFDGSAHLVISAHSSRIAEPDPSRASLVAADGTVSPSFQLADFGFEGKAAFDGANHLVALRGCIRGGCGFIGQRVTPAGQLLDGRSGFVISPMGEDAQSSALAYGASRSLFVYTRWTSGSVDIRGVRIDPSGAVLDNFSIRGPMPAPLFVGNPPAVGFDGGNFLVAWPQERPGESSPSTIVAVRITPGGVVLDSPPIAIATSLGSKYLAGLACDGTRCLVVWGDSGIGGAGFADLHAARIDRGGSLLDGPPEAGGIVVNALPGYSKGGTSVAFDGRAFVVAWWINGYEAPAGVYAARLSPEGVLLDGTATGIRLSRVGKFASRAVSPFVAPASEGRTLIAWTYNAEVGGQTKSVEGVWYQW